MYRFYEENIKQRLANEEIVRRYYCSGNDGETYAFNKLKEVSLEVVSCVIWI